MGANESLRHGTILVQCASETMGRPPGWYRFDPRCGSHDVARVILDARRRLGVGVSAVCARSTRASYPCEHQQNVFLLGNLMDWTQNRVAEPHLPLR